MQRTDKEGTDFDADLEAEKRKISELFREIKGTGDAEPSKLNWMYKNPLEMVDREEYLLGRSVDKALDAVTGRQQTSNTELANYSRRVINAHGGSEQIDLPKKIQEDPLFAMRQRELNARKELLNNPLKVKEIKKMLQVEEKRKYKAERLARKAERRRIREDRVNLLLLKTLKKLEGKVSLQSLLQNPNVSYSNPKKKRRKESSSFDSSSESVDSSEEEKPKKKKRRFPDTRKDNSQRNDYRNERDNGEMRETHDNRSRANRDKSGNNKDDRKRELRPLKKRKNSESGDSSSEGSEFSRKKKRPSNSDSSKKSKNIFNKKDSTEESSSSGEGKELSKKGKRQRGSDNKKRNKIHSKRRDSSSDNESSSKVKHAKTKQEEKYARKQSNENSIKHKNTRKQPESRSATGYKNSTKDSKKEKKSETVQKDEREKEYSNWSADSNEGWDIAARLDVDGRSPKKPKTFGLSTLDGSKPDKTEKYVEPYKKREEVKPMTAPKKATHVSKKERDRQLKEMMDNASSRKKQREDEYKKYKKSREREDKIEDFDDAFVNKEMSKLSGQGSMEDRIKSKRNTIQRSGFSMDTSFVRK